MMMTKTPYTIDNLKVMKHGKIEAHGFGDMESALHSVWVMNGKKQGAFYVEINGDVFLQEELKDA